MDLYSSISKELLTKYVTILKEGIIRTLFHDRKSSLFDKTSVWVKKDNADLNVTMGSYEVCELVGFYLRNL